VLRRLLSGLRPPRRRPPPVAHETAAPPAGAREWHGPVTVSYAPEADGHPDPGEVVWTWVPYEEDPSVGKDRPAVVVGMTADGRLALVALSSRAHPGDPDWVAIGSGGWDRRRRPSSVRVDRVLAVDPGAVRREGAVLERPRFDAVVAALRARHRA
jgi:hypothetical protein